MDGFFFLNLQTITKHILNTVALAELKAAVIQWQITTPYRKTNVVGYSSLVEFPISLTARSQVSAVRPIRCCEVMRDKQTRLPDTFQN
jgi:hypothetical protein